MTRSDRLKQIIGGTLGFVVVVLLLQSSPVAVFVRDVILAWLLAFAASRWVWRKLRKTGAIQPVHRWHGGQLTLACGGALLVAVLAATFFVGFVDSYGDEVFSSSSIPRLIALLAAFVALAAPIFLFVAAWLWFGARAPSATE